MSIVTMWASGMSSLMSPVITHDGTPRNAPMVITETWEASDGCAPWRAEN